jgi:hypothetical protein
MYPRAFHYHRANTLQEAAALLAEFGDDAKLLAGGQSLIPLMKLRLANPSHLVDLTVIPDMSYIKEENGVLRFGALTRHAEIEASGLADGAPHSYSGAKGMREGGAGPIPTISAALQDAVFANGIIIDDSFNNADSLSRALEAEETQRLVRVEKRI